MRRLIRGILMFFGAVFLGFMILIGVGIWMARGPAMPTNGILLVHLHGPLHEAPTFSFASAFGETPHLTLHELTEVIRRAGKDPTVHGLVLRIEDPEMGLSQIQEVADAMVTFQESGKWNAAFLDTAGEVGQGDGAYALAATTDHVVMAPPGAVHLFGLQSQVPFVNKMLQKLKITPYFWQRKEYKSSPNMFTHTESTPAQRQNLSLLVNDLQQSLVTFLAKRRHVSEDTVRGWISGPPHQADEAQRAGMIDAVGYWDSLRDEGVKRMNGDKHPFIDADVYAQHAVDMHPNAPTVALIIASGMIVRGESRDNPAGQSTVGSDSITEALRHAREDKVAGVLLRINSPGGSYVASDLIRREVQLTRDAGIPVVVSMGDMAASGGYFIAMDANTIVAQPTTITGSIGVYAGTFAMRAFLNEWLGITFDSYDAIPNPNRLSWLDPPTPEANTSLNAMMDHIYNDFVTKAATGRHAKFDLIEPVARGQVWSGQTALKHGLVDHLGGMQIAVAQLRKLAKLKDDQVIHFEMYPAPKTALEIAREIVRGEASMQSILAQLGVQHVLGNSSVAADTWPLPLQHAKQLVEQAMAPAQDGLLMCPYGVRL